MTNTYFITFLIGFEIGKRIEWMLFYTNPASVQYNQASYDIKVKYVIINTITSFHLYYGRPQFVDENMFFGRGAINTQLSNKRIALVGLGAIGSLVAESLAHSGIKKIGLWDSDIVEPGNICRSAYQLVDLGDSKVDAIKSKIISINPFIDIKEIKGSGQWGWSPNWCDYLYGSFYDNVNYQDQEDSIKQLEEYDIIIDCTGSNEMLHFLSYAIQDNRLIGLCITNHANDLICTTNLNGNPFELRKAYLSRIAQDTKNFYVEGSGCYSPTFLAKYFDIVALINYFVKDLDYNASNGNLLSSCIYSYRETGILKDTIKSYKLRDYNIKLHIPSETLLDAEEMFETDDSYLGYILGCYNAKGSEIMITQIIPAHDAINRLKYAFETSKGIIDYIGDFTFTDAQNNSYSKSAYENLVSKAEDLNINTNNPLLALKHDNGKISFMLLINEVLVPFF